ncbi:oxidoreductase, partial [Trichodelitschia bisporula]
MSTLLSGTAFITGAGSGIGQSVAYAFARDGITNLALADINKDGLSTTAAELSRRHPNVVVELITLDTSNEAAVDAAIAKTVEKFGRLDVAVNNAGIAGPQKGGAEAALKDWQRCLDVNLTGVWLCQRAELRVMLKQERKGTGRRAVRGSIVNTASMLGLIASGELTPATAYTSSKHGVMGLTKTDAVLYAPEGVRINAMCPGYVDTPLMSVTSGGVMEKEIAKVPMGRMCMMEEIADAVAFLASERASYMTGAGLVVDGGFTV